MMSDEQRSGGSVERDADFSKLEETPDAGGGVGGEAGARPGGESSELAALRAEIAEHKDRYLRALADLENYKKRALKERSELLKYQGERVIGDFLEVLDTLELAVAHGESDPSKVQEGIKLIHKMFVDTLGRWDVRSDSAIGGDFDPVKHKAISRLVVGDKKPGTVVGELKKTYFYKDKLLRAGEVVVAAPPADETSSERGAGEQSE